MHRLRLEADAPTFHSTETITMTTQSTSFPKAGTKTIEDIGVRFVTAHVGKIYLLLLVTTMVVVAIKEQLI